MSKIPIESIVSLLKHKDRYVWLNVFASEVALSTKTTKLYKMNQPHVYEAIHDGDRIRVQLDRQRNVARFRLLDASSEEALREVAEGIDFSSNEAQKSPASLGVLLALLVGREANPRKKGEEKVDENQIFALCYDASAGAWKAYQGDYLAYAKFALHPFTSGFAENLKSNHGRILDWLNFWKMSRHEHNFPFFLRKEQYFAYPYERIVVRIKSFNHNPDPAIFYYWKDSTGKTGFVWTKEKTPLDLCSFPHPSKLKNLMLLHYAVDSAEEILFQHER